MKKKLSTLFAVLVSLGFVLSACAAPPTAESTQAPRSVPLAYTTALPAAPSSTPKPAPKFEYFVGDPKIITQNPADVVFWIGKGYQDPPKVEFNGQFCTPVAWYGWDGRTQLEKDFDRAKGHVFVTWRDSNNVVLETELDPTARFGYLWQCDRLDLMVKFIKSYSYERERQGLNVEVIGSPIVPPAPLCSYDPQNAEFLVGKRVKIVFFDNTWTALEYEGHVYCIALRSIAEGERPYLGYKGRFVDPVNYLSYDTHMFNRMYGPYPIGTEGIFGKEEKEIDILFAPYFVRVDGVVGLHDADLTKAFVNPKYQVELQAFIRDQDVFDWKKLATPGATTIEQMCYIMINFDYAIPSPLRYCSRDIDPSYSFRWRDFVAPPVGDDVHGWMRIIPTDEERKNAKELVVTGCTYEPRNEFYGKYPYIVRSSWGNRLLTFSTRQPYLWHDGEIFALVCEGGWKEVK